MEKKGSKDRLRSKLKARRKKNDQIVIQKLPELRNVKHTFSPDELQKFSRQLAEACASKDSLDAEKKSVMSSYKSKIDDADAKVQLLSKHINMGYEHRMAECEVRKNFETGKKEYWFDKKKVDEVMMTAADHQLDISEDTVVPPKEEGKDANFPADGR